MIVFNHIKRESLLHPFTFDYLAAVLLLTSCRLDGNHGCFSGSIVADLDRNLFFFVARLQENDSENAPFDLILGVVLIGESEDTVQLLISGLDLVVGYSINPQQKVLRLGIG